MTIHINNKENNLNSKKFKISVVTAVYNTEEYLSEAIDSVINQTLDFKENIQLILVDDGSQDNSLKICKEYQSKYPENIVVYSQENSGQAAARNNGLKFVEAKYVNFLDSDDYFSLETFENVLNFFEQHCEETDIVSVPIRFFDRMNRPHPLNFKYESDRIIDLTEEPYNPQYHTNSAFFNIENLKEIEFPLDVMPSEDAVMINRILLKRRKLGVVKDACYYYRKRQDETSSLDIHLKKKEYYTFRVKKYFLGLINYALDNYGEVPKFLEYTIANDLYWLLAEPEIAFTDDSNEIEEFFHYLNEVVSYISFDTINNLNIANPDLKSYFLYFKNKECSFDLHDDVISLKVGDKEIDKINYHKFWLDIIEMKDNHLNITGAYNGLIDNKYLSVEAINETSDGKVENTLAKQEHYVTREGQKFLTEQWKYAYNFYLKIPIYEELENTIKLKINFHVDGDNTNFEKSNVKSVFLRIDFQPHASLYKYSNYSIKDSQILYFKDNEFKIEPYNSLELIKHELLCIRKIRKDKYYNYKTIIRLRLQHLKHQLFKRKKNPIYLFMDRINESQDNGEVLWKYFLSKEDNIEKYFVIDENSPDFERLSKIGKVIPHKSFKHKSLFLLADKVISSQPDEDTLNPFHSYERGKDLRRLVCGLTTADRVFLQHGVIQNNISFWLSKYDKNLAYFLTSSDYEKNSLVETLEYDEDRYHVLGLPRFDNLENNPVKQILICPTWRFHLMGRTVRDKYTFMNSDYYKDLYDLLSDNNLIELSKEYGCKIVFKPHPRMSTVIAETGENYLDFFDIHERIEIAHDEPYNVLMNESSLMITDYSSVAFDFAYLKKPIIYYQSNDDLPHEPGYFDYETMGFGAVSKNKTELINMIEHYLKNNFNNDEKYNKRVESFFKYHDKNNRQRVYESIVEK